MKHIIILVSLFSILTISCNPLDRGGHSIMNITMPGNEQRLIIRDENLSLDVEYSGDVTFNEEETAIENISDGGYVNFRKNGKRLLAESNGNGGVVYKFYNGDDGRVQAGMGKKFLTEAIHDMIDNGLFIKGRMERLYQQGGIPSLLAELERTKADHVKKIYIEYMLQSDTVSKEQMKVVCKAIGTTITSDHDKKNLLEKLPPTYLEDSLILSEYFAVIETINSDNEKANTLKRILREPLAEPGYKYLLKATASINSDHDKANVISEFVNNRELTVESYESLVAIIQKIQSDHDKSNMLRLLIEKQLYPGEQFSKLLKAVSGISSDHDKSNLFRKLAEQPVYPEEDWVNLISETKSINSENNKADALIAISKHMPLTERTKEVYLSTCRTINSEHDYKRAIGSMQ